MPLKKKEKAKAEIDVGSFSDISFLLIIFFILTTSLSRPTGRSVDIPAASPPDKSATKSEDHTPSVNVMGDRILFGEGGGDANEEVSFPELRTVLVKRNFPSLPEKDRMVVVEVADDVDWDRYFKVVSMIAECGGIVALVEEEEK